MDTVGDAILRPDDPEQFAKYVGASIGNVGEVPWQKLVLVVGPPRSGSTWFARSIANSYGAQYIHEPDTRDYQSIFTPALLTFRWVPSNFNIPQDMADWHKSVLLNHMANIMGPEPTVIVKFTQVMRAEYYRQTLQSARYVFIVRCVEAMHNSYKNKGWLENVLNREYVEAMLSDVHQHFEWTYDPIERFYIRTMLWYDRIGTLDWPIFQYEDLVSNPMSYRDVFEQLGLEPATPLDAKIERKDAWKKELLKDELAAFQRLKVKYKPITSLGDSPIIDYMHVG